MYLPVAKAICTLQYAREAGMIMQQESWHRQYCFGAGQEVYGIYKELYNALISHIFITDTVQ
jgi:hypothetical protein